MADLPPELELALLALVREKLFDGGEALTIATDLFAAGLDSMGIMQLMILVEERFGVRIPESAVTRENFATVASFAAMVRRCGAPA
ncbi:MAG: phosphopantetheine-binding protein [Chthoniobacterales bacterium]|jgi:acyl carrier protein